MEPGVDIGRNQPCPCGSGRKFKKCCADAPDRALQVAPGELDAAALINRVVQEDDWALLDPHVDTIVGMIAPGQPLEHLRFPDDALATFGANPEPLCRDKWLVVAERELIWAIEHVELGPFERDALRVAIQLDRRFGARSPIIEELASLQLSESQLRARQVADAMSRAGLPAGSTSPHQLLAWLGSGPALLPFVDWLALTLARYDDMLLAAWYGGIARRLCDTCLDLAASPLGDRLRLTFLALVTIHPTLSADIAPIVARHARLLDPSLDEQRAYDLLSRRRDGTDQEFASCMQQVAANIHAHGSYAHAALLRSIETRELGQLSVAR